jgi:hypothetical protein
MDKFKDLDKVDNSIKILLSIGEIKIQDQLPALN